MIFNFGLKIWSINLNYVEEVKKLYKQKIFDYIELYSVPGSFDTTSHIWDKLDIPYVIHAPHYKFDMNLARKDSFNLNLSLAEEAINFADSLKSHYIIFHPGTNGDIKETVKQINHLNDKRIIIENKPYKALDKGLICNGASLEEIEYLLNNTNAGFCLDIGHAICSANHFKLDQYEFLQKLIDLKPIIYHLTDGDNNSVYDDHSHFGKGNYDLSKILKMIPENSNITIETIKDSPYDLNDFEEDIKYLRKSISQTSTT